MLDELVSNKYAPAAGDTVTIDGVDYLTRAWYMKATLAEQPARHRTYYQQFVTDAVKQIVRAQFKNSWRTMTAAFLGGDKHFNSCTSLDQWDVLSGTIRNAVGSKVTKTAYANPQPGMVYWSLSDNICICKEAARMMIEQENADV